MSSIYKELSFENDTELIQGIQFTVMSPDEIRKMSVAEIVSTDTFSGNEPVIGGLFDNRMGVIEHNKICKTCEQKNTFCPGHFGHIELATPVFYIQFFDMIRKLLKCVCWRCSKLLVDTTNDELNAIRTKKISRQKRFELIYKLCSKVKRCGSDNSDGCGAKLPNKITKEKIGRICMEWKDTNEDEVKKQVFNADEVLIILKGITSEDAELLGFGVDCNKPEWLICTVFPVPPPSVRPSVRNDTGQRCEDDLTHKLCDIVKTNNMLKQKSEKNASKEQLDYWSILLQYHISTFVDNQLPGVAPAKQRTGRPLRSITERLKSKEGRIRGNLMGKRVDFSARSVITPDPGISIDELGVPIKIAMNLTFPEVVNRYNREEMKQLVMNGSDVYPGAKYVRKHNENYRTIRLKNMDSSLIELADGDIVDRHLRNGDYVLFNRQPSLHKMSMMAHKVRVMPYDTFRLNVCVTPSYNADYDGDEMNMHVPQSLQTENELIQLASVPTQIISPRDARPIVSIVQDIALGVYRITKDEVQLSQKQFFNLLSSVSKFCGMYDEPACVSQSTGLKRWSGRQLLSTVIPPNINLQGGNKSYDADKESSTLKNSNYVKIENGQIVQGIVDKKIYQDRTNGIIHIAYNDNSAKECVDIFDNTQKLICDWLVYDGFSVGISDLLIDQSTSKKIKEIITELKTDVYTKIRDIHLKRFQNPSIKTNQEYFEEIISKSLNAAENSIGKLGMENIDEYNRMLNMIKSGSKGSTINLVQMVGSLGQQSVEGKRISYGFDDRTLPHFTKYDDGPASRGFVESSFVKGLTPQEFFFHAMGGREGLIDTAVKTSEIGYLQRKLVKAMEDCKVSFDMSVRNASGNIVQFLYGDDGMNAIKLESQTLKYVEYDREKMRSEYLLSYGDLLKNYLDERTISELYEVKDWDRRMYEYYEQVMKDKEFLITKVFKGTLETKLVYPIAFQRILTNMCMLFKLANKCHPSNLNPLYVLKTVEELETKALVINKLNTGKMILGVLLRYFLNPKALIMKYHFTKEAFDAMIQKITFKFYEAIVSPSEMVGVVAAQSIGEPCTQLTLNSVEYNTEIIVNENGKLKEYRIGEWIDNRITHGDKSTYEYIKQGDQIYAPMSKDEDIRILTCDENGQVFWDHVDAVTRHLPINEDGSNTLIRVTTLSGHECVVTKGDSVLTRQNNKLLKSKGSDLKVGDYLPAMKTLPIPDSLKMDVLDISEYISKRKYIFMSEVEKAFSVQKECQCGHGRNGTRHSWTSNNGTRVELPFTRSNGFVNALMGIGNQIGRIRTPFVKKSIPEKLELDELFGFVIGSYLAEGCSTKYHVLISNNQNPYIDKIKRWADRYHIHYQLENDNKGRSQTIRMHSLVLAELFGKLFHREVTDNDTIISVSEDNNEQVIDHIIDEKQSKGSFSMKSSPNTKHLPVVFLGAPDDCLKGLIDGYFSGGVGSISHNLVEMTATSVTKRLLDNVSLILRKFGILSAIRKLSPSMYKDARKHGYYQTSTMPIFEMFINKHNSIKFANTFTLTLKTKQDRLSEFKNEQYTKDSLSDKVPNVTLTNGQIIDEVSLDAIDLETYKNTEDYDIMRTILEANVFYDRVVKLEEVRSNYTHVYDLTTRFSRNFADKCMIHRDTFHLSGVASASKAVRGVPRIKELLSVSKNTKAPSCVVYLKPEFAKDNKNAQTVANNLEITYMKSVVSSTMIYYEPDTVKSDIEEDHEFLDFYNRFTEFDTNCDRKVSPWVLRIELNKLKMAELDLDTIDIHYSIYNFYEDTINCKYSDDHADKIIFRVRLLEENIEDAITELKALEYNLLESIVIKGVPGIKKVSYRKHESFEYDSELQTFAKEKSAQWILDVEGTNLMQVLGHPMVDNTTTISNDINEIYQTLGIEAARESLLNEIKEVLNDGANVNYRHVALLVDTMTSKGYMLSIDRHGINRSDIGPLAKSSFEETSDMIIKAGIFSEYDRVNGVSANIMMGQVPPCGTGDSQIFIDEDKIMNIPEWNDDDAMDDEDDYEEDNENVVFEDMADCNLDFDREFQIIEEFRS
jgi:DNA-directed RNA polymerase beta' subunit